jgi:hypothetical protein
VQRRSASERGVMQAKGIMSAYAENPGVIASKNSAANLIFTMTKEAMQKTIDYCICVTNVMGR